VLDGCTFMFEQFTYNVAKPAAVAKALEDAGFTAEHVRVRRNASPSCSLTSTRVTPSFALPQAGAVSAVWVAEAEPLLKRVQSEQFGPRTLDSISWSLNLQSSEDTQGRMSKPTTVMELELKDVDAGPDGTQAVEHISIEASHDELHASKLLRTDVQDRWHRAPSPRILLCCPGCVPLCPP
jgi:hypothetical protein